MAFADGDLDRFITITEAGARLHCSRAKAYRMVANDEFPVPVHVVAGKQVVSLRQLAEFMYGAALLEQQERGVA